jgi:hypothetical protein
MYVQSACEPAAMKLTATGGYSLARHRWGLRWYVRPDTHECGLALCPLTGQQINGNLVRMVGFSYFVTISYVIVNGINRTLDDEV